MEKLRNLLKKIQTLNVDIMMYDIFNIKAVQDKAIELNHNQLRASRTSKNEVLLGDSGNPIDLYDTGRFYDTFELINRIGMVEIIANTTIYGTDFKEKYSENITGLTEESLNELQIFIIPYIQEYLLDYLEN